MSQRGRRQGEPRRSGESGQALYEFAIIVPVLFLLLMGMLEFGFVFLHHLSLNTRRARAPAQVPPWPMAPSTTRSATPATARSGRRRSTRSSSRPSSAVLTSTGSQLALSDGSNGVPQTTITIYEADADGNQIGPGTRGRTRDPKQPQTIPCQSSTPPPTFTPLDFTQGAVNWPAASRNNGPTPDSIGVAIDYTYVYQTPLDGIMAFVSGIISAPRLSMTDRTVMALEPTK